MASGEHAASSGLSRPRPGGTADPARPGGSSLTARALGYVLLAHLTVLGMIGGAGLTDTSGSGWASLVVAALLLWAGWLYWRTALGDRHVPGHWLQPFLGGVVVILAAHLLAGGLDGAGRGAGAEVSLLTRLLMLALLLLMVQDVMSRVRHLRWLLTGIGAVLAVGALLRLHSDQPVAGAQAITMGGFVGVGILLAPCWVPSLPGEQVLRFIPPRLLRFAVVVRVGLAGLLAALLMVAGPESAEAAVLTAAAAGGALLLAGGMLGHHRFRLVAAGAAVLAGAVAAAWQIAPSAPDWLGRVTLLGSGRAPRHGGASGLEVIGASAGWAGVAAIAAGMVLTLARSLYAARKAAPGDQARAALWAAVAAVAGAALLAPGGLNVAAVAVTAALAWGLMPRVMVCRARRFRGLGVVVAFAAALVVLALEQTARGSVWFLLAERYGDGLMHLFGTFILTVVLGWQVRARRWWQALLCAAAAAAMAAAGELGQQALSTRSPEWRDVGWDCLGAGAALAALLLMQAAAWVEQLVSARPRVSTAGYEPWRRFAGPTL